MKSSSMQKTVNSSFGFTVFILGILAGSLFLTSQRLDTNFHRLALNYQVVDTLYKLKHQSENCHENLKDYFKSPKAINLQIYKVNSSKIRKNLKKLSILLKDDKSDFRFLKKADKLTQNNLLFLNQLILAHKNHTFIFSNPLTAYRSSVKLINQQEYLFQKNIQEIIQIFHNDEINQSIKAGQLTQRLSFFVFCSSAGILLTLLIAYFCIMREALSHQRTQSELSKTHQHVLEVSQTKSNFLAMMGHEIKSPLSGIQGLADNLLNSPLSPAEHKSHLQLIRNSSSNILTVIEDILYFSCAEAKKIKLVESSFSLRELLYELMQVYGQLAYKKKLNLMYYVSSDIPDYLIADQHCLRRILSNLIENAIKYTEFGEVFLEVEPIHPAKQSTENGITTIRFNIQDTGLGISSEQLALIFQPYTQAHNHTHKKHPGSGLGLSICQSLIEMMDGKIEVRSTPSIGSAFSLTIPIQISESAKQDWQRFKNKMIQMTSISILVFTRNKTIRKNLEQILYGWHFSPVFTDQTEQTFDMLTMASQKGAPYQVLIIDDDTLCTSSLIERIRNTETICDMRIVLIGNHQPSPDTEISAYLGKPICPTHLLKTLWQLNHNYSLLQKYIPSPQKVVSVASKPYQILLAEDNEVNQAFIEQSLTNQGYEITIAATGAKVLEWLKQKKFDLILMDLELPEMDGFTVTKQIREAERQKRALQTGYSDDCHIPILALTAHNEAHILSNAIESGIDDYLLKPFKIGSLQKKLSEHLQMNQASVEASNSDVNNFTQNSIDQIDMQNQSDEKREQLKHLVSLFEQSTSKQLSGIYAAIEQESIDALHRNIHALKGGISIFTTGKAYQIAKSFEDSTLSSHKKEYATFKRKADELQIEVEALRENLYSLLKQK